MAAPRKRTKAKTQETSKLIEALKFTSTILKKEGDINETFVNLNNKWAFAFNGILAIGHPIEEDIKACPHNYKLLEALSKCGQNISITQMDENRLSIKSDKMKAIVPCIDYDSFFVMSPDTPQAEVSDKFIQAANLVSIVSKDDTNEVVTSSILLNGQSVIGTDSKLIIEYWHGLNMPVGISVPKALISTIVKIGKSVSKVGCSPSSITFWFEDGSWIKSQLFADPWPNISRILDVNTNPVAIPKGLQDGINSVEAFSDDGFARFINNHIKTHDSEGIGAEYELEGVPNGVIVNIKYMNIILKFVNKIDWFSPSGNILFYGENIRGAMAGIHK